MLNNSTKKTARTIANLTRCALQRVELSQSSVSFLYGMFDLYFLKGISYATLNMWTKKVLCAEKLNIVMEMIFNWLQTLPNEKKHFSVSFLRHFKAKYKSPLPFSKFTTSTPENWMRVDDAMGINYYNYFECKIEIIAIEKPRGFSYFSKDSEDSKDSKDFKIYETWWYYLINHNVSTLLDLKNELEKLFSIDNKVFLQDLVENTKRVGIPSELEIAEICPNRFQADESQEINPHLEFILERQKLYFEENLEGFTPWNQLISSVPVFRHFICYVIDSNAFTVGERCI